MSRILITGATGFLGRALVGAARSAGHDVIAVSRGARHVTEWDADTGINHVQIDLGAAEATEALAQSLDGVGAVIHAAASFAGDAQTHARDTIGATDHLVQALQIAGAQIRLVLVSSLSVYDVAAMEDGTRLDEGMPLIETAAQRDAYGAAKVAQEKSLRDYTGPKQVIRPGAIYGPHRLWSAQLGFAKFGVVFCPGTTVQMPAIEVNRAAAAILRAACTGDGADVVNLIEPNPPTRRAWLSALGLRVVPVAQSLVLLVGAMTGRGPSWRARFRPLHYDTSRAQALLDPTTQRPFADMIAAAKRHEEDHT